MGRRSTFRDSAFAVLARGKRVLLVQTRCGRWQLPGGRLERGETPWEAVLREVREETGLRVRLLGLTGVYPRKDETRAVVFAAEVPRCAALPGPRHEIRDQRWVPVRESRALLARGARRRLFDSLAARRHLGSRHARVATWRAALRRSG